MQAVQNLGLAVFSIVTGLIADTTGYLVLEVFFLGLLCGEAKVDRLYQWIVSWL